MLNLKAVDYVC